MAPKSKPTGDRPDRKSSAKGKQRADPPSHHDEGDQAGSSAGASGSSPRAPTVPKKTKAQLREDAEDAYIASQISDDSIEIDMRGADPRHGLISRFLELPPLAIPARPGPSTLDVSPAPSPLAPSSASSLQPPAREDNSSSASSRGSKRRREPSPHRRLPRRPEPQSRGGSPPRYPPARSRGESPPRRSATDQQVAMLQQQLRHYHEEVLALRRQNSHEFNLGFHTGRSAGFADAMRMSAPSPYDRPDPRGRTSYRDDDAHDDEMQRAIRASRHETRRDHPGDTPGAGPSRAPSHSRPRPSAPSQPRADPAASSHLRAQVPPVAPTTTPVPPTAAAANHHDYVVDVVFHNGDYYPDPTKTKWPGFACVPLPFGVRPSLTGGPITVPGPITPPKPEDATSYLELWAGFANGRTVPDPFRRFFNAGVRA